MGQQFGKDCNIIIYLFFALHPVYPVCVSVCLCVRMCLSLSLASHFLESLSRQMAELRIWKLSQFGISALVCTCLCMCKEGWDNGNWKSSKMGGLRTNYRKIKCWSFFRGVEKSEDQVGMRIIVPVDTSGCSFWHLVHCRLYYTSRPRLINDLRSHVTNVETAGLSAVRLHTVFVFVTAFLVVGVFVLLCVKIVVS